MILAVVTDFDPCWHIVILQFSFGIVGDEIHKIVHTIPLAVLKERDALYVFAAKNIVDWL